MKGDSKTCLGMAHKISGTPKCTVQFWSHSRAMNKEQGRGTEGSRSYDLRHSIGALPRYDDHSTLEGPAHQIRSADAIELDLESRYQHPFASFGFNPLDHFLVRFQDAQST